MGFKPVNTQATDIKKHIDKPFVGEYKGSTEITTKIGQQIVYNFVDEGGVPFAIYGFTNLNRTMEHIGEGTVCRITYKGTVNVQTKFGMKDVHQVLVEIDDGEGNKTIDHDEQHYNEPAQNMQVKKDDDLPF